METLHEPTDANDEALHPALADLFDRLSRQPDFPSLADRMPEVRRLARCEKARVQTLSGALLKDIGLSHRLLRLVNAAYYRSVGAGSIATVTRAISVMGFEAIGRLSVGARLVEAAAKGSGALLLREECLRSMLAATLADLLSPGRMSPEDAYVAALFRNIGRLLFALHRPVEAQAVRAAIEPATWPRSSAEELVSRGLLGSGYGEIGRHLAQQWGWPAALREAMQRDRTTGGAPPRGRFDAAGLAALCDELADALLYRSVDEARAACEPLAAVHPGGPSARELEAVLDQGRLLLGELAQAMDLSLAKLPTWGRGTASRTAEAADDLPAALATPASERPTLPLRGAELLSVAIQDLSATMLSSADIAATAPSMVLESLWRGLDARRAVVCLRQGASGPLVGQQSLEHDGPGDWHAAFRIDPAQHRDLFALLCRRGADTMIDDLQDPRIAERLPAWFRSGSDHAQRFLVLPMHARGVPVGLIYLDGRRDGDLRPGEQQLRLARTLRNQLTLALGYGS